MPESARRHSNELGMAFEVTTVPDGLLLTWHHAPGLSVQSFQTGIHEFAKQCARQRPARAAIDAVALDQTSPAVGWLRGTPAESGLPEYNEWWATHIVPLYREGGVECLVVATGSPEAPGLLKELSDSVGLQVVYVHTLADALAWHVG